MNFKKILFTASLIAFAGIMTGCDSRPTLDRSILEGYNNCVAAREKAEGELAAANARARAEAGGIFRSETMPTFRDCKSEYGIPGFMDVTKYRIVN